MARGYFQSAGLNAGESLGLVHATLAADAWVGDSTNGYQQAIAALGVTSDATCSPQIQLEHVAGTTRAEWEAQCDAYANFCATGWTETAASAIIFYTYEVPTVDIPLIIYGYDYVPSLSQVSGTTDSVSVVQSNVNGTGTIPSSKVVYDLNAARVDEITAINDSLNNLNVLIDYSQGVVARKTITTANTWNYYTIPTADMPTPPTGYYFIGFVFNSANSIALGTSYQSNSHDIWFYARITGTAVINAYPIFIRIM